MTDAKAKPAPRKGNAGKAMEGKAQDGKKKAMDDKAECKGKKRQRVQEENIVEEEGRVGAMAEGEEGDPFEQSEETEETMLGKEVEEPNLEEPLQVAKRPPPPTRMGAMGGRGSGRGRGRGNGLVEGAEEKGRGIGRGRGRGKGTHADAVALPADVEDDGQPPRSKKKAPEPSTKAPTNKGVTPKAQPVAPKKRATTPKAKAVAPNMKRVKAKKPPVQETLGCSKCRHSECSRCKARYQAYQKWKQDNAYPKPYMPNLKL